MICTQTLIYFIIPTLFYPKLYIICIILFIIGFIVSIFMVNFWIHQLFYRKVPLLINYFKVYYYISQLIFPLITIFRMMTSHFRVLPNVILIGETRCGTTTLAYYLKNHKLTYGPFTQLLMPHLSGKECYYFLGANFGYIHPYFYKSCFPTTFELRIRLFILRYIYPILFNNKEYVNITMNDFIIFDATPLYLSNKWVAIKLIETYKLFYGKNYEKHLPKLIVCVREPIQQNISWYTFEERAQDWGTYVAGLRPFTKNNIYEPYKQNWPEKLMRSTFYEWFQFSKSNKNKKDYANMEQLIFGGHNKLPENYLFSINGVYASLSIMGRYIENIEYYQQYFGNENIIIFDFDDIIHDINKTLSQLSNFINKPEFKFNSITKCIHLNKGPSKDINALISNDELNEMGNYYKSYNIKLFELMNKNLNWHNKYFYYT